ncbi:hypothetical protein ABDK56_06180 [Sphingomonas sp. ASV193]|uniref:hypothetical protein n=1 Tax=Sphingomonas sp. ASV193 TaxID=3144405 RepID=UPI0032E8F03B
MRHSKLAVALSAIALVALPASVSAGAPAKTGSTSNANNCWGVVSAQLAQIEGGLGSHVREQSEPRLGLGNVADLFYEMGLIDSPTVSALGSFLASVDEYDGTSCPAN